MARTTAQRMKYGKDGDVIVKWFRGKAEEITENSRQALQMAAERGKELVQYNIATRGAALTNPDGWDSSWDRMAHATPGRYVSEPGRVASGRMYDAVDSWYLEGSDGKARIGFGFTNPQNRETYFEAQEGGFTHNFTGKHIRGMYAVHDAADEVLAQLKKDLRKAIK